MNTEQTDIHTSFQSWWEKNFAKVGVHSTIRASAEVVWTACYAEVLKRLPGEWIILSPHAIHQIGDEVHDGRGWDEVHEDYVGEKVGGNVLCRRRIVPKQQPKLGSP
jgi:hypothetical protein